VPSNVFYAVSFVPVNLSPPNRPIHNSESLDLGATATNYWASHISTSSMKTALSFPQ
jgi:hypothetical protein